jgi:hypothetical protein
MLLLNRNRDYYYVLVGKCFLRGLINGQANAGQKILFLRKGYA